MWQFLKSSWYTWRQIRGPYVVRVLRIQDDDDDDIKYETVSRHADESDAYDAAMAINSSTLLHASVWYQWGDNDYTAISE